MLTFLAVLGVLVVSCSGSGCSCDMQPSFDEHICTSSNVVKVSIIQEANYFRYPGHQSYKHWLGFIREIFIADQGISDFVYIRSALEEAACGLPLEPGTEMLLSLNRTGTAQKKNKFSVNQCDVHYSWGEVDLSHPRLKSDLAAQCPDAVYVARENAGGVLVENDEDPDLFP